MGRGYSIVRRKDGKVVKSAKDVKSGERVTVKMKMCIRDRVKAAGKGPE